MRGIVSYGAYLPHRRLDRAEIAPVAGTGGGKGTRTVASFDEDTTTMGVEAARLTLRAAPDTAPATLWFATVAPAYLDKTNATAIHAALRLDSSAMAADFGGAIRSGVAALRAALSGPDNTLVVSADIRTGLPGGADEANGGDAGAALLVGDDGVIAECIGVASATSEFTDRWRTPGDNRSKVWEERFGETQYVPLGEQAWNEALKAARLTAEQVDRIVVTGPHQRAVNAFARKIAAGDRLVPDLAATVGYTGAASPTLLLGAALDEATPGQVIALVSLADGADVLVFRTTDAIASFAASRPVAQQAAAGAPIPYGKYLAWRGLLPVQPPNRPEPARISASAAGRTVDWKYGFAGHADVVGTITTFTIDRLAYSPSPPVVFAVVDFEDGERQPLELADVDVAEVAIGKKVEMTFRRLFTADGLHNYFWKARLVR
jgi:3-hydroxy-3-methylglutaryl CoA synthase